MIDAPFRRVLPRFVAPVLRFYERCGLSPNGVSVLGFALASAAAVCILYEWRLAAVVLWWTSRLADGTDGIYARHVGRSSDFGAYLDIVLDMASYSVIVLALAQVHPELHGRWLAMLFFYVLCITSALALGAEEAKQQTAPQDDRGLRLGAGLAEGGETGIAYTLFLLLPAWLPELTALWIAVLATTVVARSVLAHRSLRA